MAPKTTKFTHELMIVFGIGFLLRLWLSCSSIAEWLGERNEVVTPLTSWNRVIEGLAMQEMGDSPYSGDTFHQMPLILSFVGYMTSICGSYIHYFFVIMDVITAIVLERIAKHLGRLLLNHQARNAQKYSKDASSLILKAEDADMSRLYVVMAFMFNPYSIATCVAKSTAVFNNLAICMAMLFTLKGSRLIACFFIALAAYMSLYPIMLVVPAALFLANIDTETKSESKKTFTCWTSVLKTCICTIAALFLLICISFHIENSWDFLNATYGFILDVPDLNPNVGVFWYLFTEMFEHYRFFFICVFQINVFIYTIPLAIRLREHPMFLMYILITIMAVFKSYPSYADAALYLAMLPMWKHTLHYLEYSFEVTMMYIVSTVLAPIFWHMWIYAGTANANFYFAITLVYSVAQVYLLTDILSAFLRREYDLLEGTKTPIINGKCAQVILQGFFSIFSDFF